MADAMQWLTENAQTPPSGFLSEPKMHKGFVPKLTALAKVLPISFIEFMDTNSFCENFNESLLSPFS
jgi:hypothetical protein